MKTFFGLALALTTPLALSGVADADENTAAEILELRKEVSALRDKSASFNRRVLDLEEKMQKAFGKEEKIQNVRLHHYQGTGDCCAGACCRGAAYDDGDCKGTLFCAESSSTCMCSGITDSDCANAKRAICDTQGYYSAYD